MDDKQPGTFSKKKLDRKINSLKRKIKQGDGSVLDIIYFQELVECQMFIIRFLDLLEKDEIVMPSAPEGVDPMESMSKEERRNLFSNMLEHLNLTQPDEQNNEEETGQ